MNPGAVPVLFGAICLGAAVWATWRWDTNYHRDVAEAPSKAPTGRSGHRMRTPAHRIVDTDPKRGNVVVRLTDRHDGHAEPRYQIRRPPNIQEVPGHDPGTPAHQALRRQDRRQDRRAHPQLHRPTSGTVTVNGKPYGQHRSPLRGVAALLDDAKAVHPGRSARSHLRTMAATHNIKTSRVSGIIEMSGVAGAATKRVGGFCLGMSQRLGIAAAPLGDPERSSRPAATRVP